MGRCQVKIALDIDGTLADFVSGFRTWCGRDLPEPRTYDFARAWDMPYWRELLRGAQREGLYRNLEPNRKAMAWLRHFRGDTVTIVTARPKSAYVDTLEWLRTHEVPFDITIMGVGSERCDLDVDLWIDDNPTILGRLHQEKKPYLVSDALYNRHIPGMRL